MKIKILAKDENIRPAYSGKGVWTGLSRLSIDAGQNPIVLLRADDGSVGCIVSVEAPAASYGVETGKLLESALEKLSAKGFGADRIDPAIVGGCDLAGWKVAKIDKAMKDAGLGDTKKAETAGLYYRKIYFDPKSGDIKVFREAANPDDWNPASSSLSIESGTKAFSDGQAGGVVANATRFFREKSTFSALRERIIMEHIRLTPDKPLNVWCAACSNGIEAYSYAMYIRHLLKKIRSKCQFHVYGTDINRSLIETAKAGAYQPNSADMKEYRNYFEKYAEISGQTIKFRDEIRRNVSFNVFDLKKEPKKRDFRLIICANVFQYYDDAAKELFLQNFIKSLLRPGYLFVKPISPKITRSYGLSDLGRFRMLRLN